VLLGQTDAGVDWNVRWVPFSLDQTKVAEGDADVWDDPEKAGVRLAVEVGIAVRDGWPDAFTAVHNGLFAARHDKGLDIREHDVVADVLTAEGLDADEVFNEVLGCGPRDTFRKEHEWAVDEHKVFGVPTVIAAGQAVFIRLVDRPDGDAARARETVERCVDLVGGWPNLNEFKHTTIPH
jgi:protein-disulfide isomerase-like protein with CxxC motif